jgi:hypothetical protein
MNNALINEKGILPFSAVEAAANGDYDALRAIVNHYRSYITALSVVRLYDPDGTPYSFIDEELRRELELRLITKALGFKFIHA